MLDGGAIAEVADLVRRRPDAPSLPIAKVHGLRELVAVVSKDLALEIALATITAQIRGYAKRQRTWFRHQLPELTAVGELGKRGGTCPRRGADCKHLTAGTGVDRAGPAD